MSYMDQKREMLKEQSGDEKKTRVIDGRLYMDYADNNVYKPVPRGMDDARDLILPQMRERHLFVTIFHFT